MSTLLGVHAHCEVGGIAQVDLDRRAHQYQSILDLAAMAVELLAVADRRRDRHVQRDVGSQDARSATQVMLRRLHAGRVKVVRSYA